MNPSLCTPPNITYPNPASVLAAVLAILSALDISLPQLPTLPQPPPFCPLD